MKRKVIIDCDYSEIDEIISNRFGKEYEIAVSNEWGNDESHELYLSKSDKFYSWDEDKLAAWLAGTSTQPPSHQYLMHILCVEDVLEEGAYLINVSW